MTPKTTHNRVFKTWNEIALEQVKRDKEPVHSRLASPKKLKTLAEHFAARRKQ